MQLSFAFSLISEECIQYLCGRSIQENSQRGGSGLSPQCRNKCAAYYRTFQDQPELCVELLVTVASSVGDASRPRTTLMGHALSSACVV